MHVIKIRDQLGIKRIYAAKLIRSIDDTVVFDFKGTELKVLYKDLLEMVLVQEATVDRIH